MPIDQNQLPSSSLPPDPRHFSPESGSPEKWLAVLAPFLLTVAAMALLAR